MNFGRRPDLVLFPVMPRIDRFFERTTMAFSLILSLPYAVFDSDKAMRFL